jgi:hypothetical protein
MAEPFAGGVARLQLEPCAAGRAGLSSVVHAAIMAVLSFGNDHHIGHLWGDVLRCSW